jgi:hypothetical protein
MKEDLDRHDTRVMIPGEGVLVVFFGFFWLFLLDGLHDQGAYKHRAIDRGMKTEFGFIQRLVGPVLCS